MDFKSALTKVCHDFSKEIIFQRRIISILDDYMAFKDVPYYKLFYKTILNIGDMSQLISQNTNERAKALYSFFAVSGLDESKIKAFLDLISECYYGKQSPAGKSDSINVNNERKQERIEQQLENTQNENISSSHSEENDNIHSQALFMGIPLGIDFYDFQKELENRKPNLKKIIEDNLSLTEHLNDDVRTYIFEKGESDLALGGVYHPFDVHTNNSSSFKFDFAGFSESEIMVLYSPFTNIVYKVLVRLTMPYFINDNDMLKKIKSMLKEKYGVPTFDNLKKANEGWTIKSNVTKYEFDKDFCIAYSMGLRGQLHTNGRCHIISYYSKNLIKKYEEEIKLKGEELIHTEKGRRIGHKKSDLNDI